METQALIFIPEISGFPNSVMQSELTHNYHIIKELAGVIINSDILGMKITGTEGVAVLFFRPGAPPSIEEIVGQAHKTFIDFHSHLKQIEKNRICQCGACCGAKNLGLKFIVHYGILKETTIQNHQQVTGKDVTLARRMIKTNIPANQYLLVTEDYLLAESGSRIIKLKERGFLRHQEEIENLGSVASYYLELLELLNHIPEAPEVKHPDYTEPVIAFSTLLEAPLSFVHSHLTDQEKKTEWVPGVKAIHIETEINRVNSGHTCVFNENEIHFITRKQISGNGSIRYVEEGRMVNGHIFINEYLLREEEGKTRLLLEVKQIKREGMAELEFGDSVRNIRDRLLIKLSRKRNIQMLEQFRDYCEKQYQRQL